MNLRCYDTLGVPRFYEEIKEAFSLRNLHNAAEARGRSFTITRELFYNFRRHLYPFSLSEECVIILLHNASANGIFLSEDWYVIVNLEFHSYIKFLMPTLF